MSRADPVRSFILLLGILLTVTACQAVAPFPEPVKVGLLLPLEGARRELSYSVLPALFAATPATVQGLPVEWVILDTRGDPETAAQRARELVIDPAVLYVLGPILADEAAAVEPVLGAAGMAWTPLVPRGDEGTWLAPWEPQCGAFTGLQPSAAEAGPCYRVRLPADRSGFENATGAEATPLSWLVWDATTFVMKQMMEITPLERARVSQAVERYPFPPLEPSE